MKKVIWIIAAIIVVAGITILACSSPDKSISLPAPSSSEDPGRVRAPEEVTLNVGESKSAAGLTIRFNTFLQDSRCASDEVCEEFGAVAVNVTFATDATSTTRNMASDEVPQQYEGYAISIVRIDPPRLLDKVIAENEYQITFRVEALAWQNPAENI